MSGIMRAAVLRHPGPKNEKPLTVEERPVPEPRPGEVLAASGGVRRVPDGSAHHDGRAEAAARSG